MSDTKLVRMSIEDGVAVLTMSNPPINAVNAKVRTALADYLIAIEAEPSIIAAVITAGGRMFSGGGDLRELGEPDAPGAVTMTDLARRVEGLTKPVICALHGQAIGGGVLLAMACHGRVGADGTRLALPEVRLGLVPGAGGTQRLPRLVGARAALDMVVAARTIDAAVAHRNGLIDMIAAKEELRDSARMFARRVAAGQAPWRRTSELDVPRAERDLASQLYANYRDLAQRIFPGREAPLLAIDLLLGASNWPFAAGIQREREIFERLLAGPQAKALLHLFFAERALGRVPDPGVAAAGPSDGYRALRAFAPAFVAPSRLVEIICDGPVDGDELAAELSRWRGERRLPVIVHGSSVAERLMAGYRRAAARLVEEGAARMEVTRAAAAECLPPPLLPEDASDEVVASEGLRRALLNAFVDEAKACWAERMTLRPADIDVIAVEGCGFPAVLGGPLHYADSSSHARDNG